VDNINLGRENYMLKILRHKKVAKIVLWAILILILPAFVIWGVGSVGRSKEKGPTFVGLIGNHKVSFEEFADSLMCMRVQIILNFFDRRQALEKFLNNKELMGKMAWDRLIMVLEAKRYRIRVADAEVVNYIKALPIFCKDGRFDERAYNYLLRNSLGLNPRSFEEMIRGNLAIQKLHNILTKDVKIADGEVLNQYKIDSEKFKIAYALLPKDGDKQYEDLRGLMEKDNIPFEAAAEKLGLKIEKTGLLSKSDDIVDIGGADQLTDAVAKLKVNDISAPIQIEKGILVFKLLEIQHFDEAKFQKEKDESAKRALEAKKNKFLEDWLRDLESKSVLKIDLKDYEKYYR